MIADLDETIRQLLISDIPIRNGEIDIKFEQPKREWSARLSKPTVNMFLYDMRENHVLRRQEWQRVAHSGRQVTEKRSPMRIECVYMMTTWAAEPEDEHRLMGRALRALFRYPKLPVDRLHGKLKRQPMLMPTQLARHDKLTNPAEVWSALDNEIRPSVSFIVTIALDPWEEVTGPAVRNLTMRTTQHSSNGNGTGGNTIDEEIVRVGGIVRDTAGATPLAGIQIAVKGERHIDITDNMGRFKFGNLKSGQYTLVVWPPDGDAVEKEITVPATDRDYDIELDL